VFSNAAANIIIPWKLSPAYAFLRKMVWTSIQRHSGWILLKYRLRIVSVLKIIG